MKYLIAGFLFSLTVLSNSGCKRTPDAPFEVLQAPEGAVQELQPLWAIPDFNLTERSGQTISLADLKGKVWIADFFYTTCPGPCPMMTSRLSDLQKQLGSEEDLRLVSISTDPAKDTPEVLKQYARKFEASDRWLFLTGDKEQIFRLANDGFKLSLVEDPSAEEPITHSTKLVLIDRAGTIRGFYEGIGEEDTTRIVKDARRLLEEKQ
ncbi:MAG: SCO family protein [Verrucomicrobiaceae bacterium]|nr:MAG: SCO family protein [Verrucomicrobiaceae bacterium]